MKKTPLLATAALVLCLSFSAWSSETGEKTVDDFRAGISEKWQIKKFHGLTHYTATIKDKQTCIEATSNGTASGLFYEIEYNAAEYPYLAWQWQIEHTIASGDVSRKATDDYAARIYVVFPDFLFWRTKALNYIWANKLPQGSFAANAFTANNMMIAVESGNDRAGQWVSEQRNIYQDFITAFGHPPPPVGAIAIMTDTDNTGETARAWYGPIRIAKNRR